MTVEDLYMKAVVLLLRAAARKLGLETSDEDELVQKASEQSGLTLDSMIGFGYNSQGLCFSVRLHEAESLLEVEGNGWTFAEALTSIIDQIQAWEQT